MIAPAPCPCASSQSMIVALASATPRPSRTARRCELIAGPSPVNALPSKPVGRLHGADDRQVEDLGELPVALVLAGHRHDRAGAVADQHVVGDEDRDLLAVDRVDRERAGEDAGLLLGVGLPLQVGLARRPPPVRRDRLAPGSACPPVHGGVGARRPGVRRRARRPAGAPAPAPCRWRRTACPAGW